MARKQAWEKYLRAYDDLADVVVLLDHQTRILYWNRSAETAFGLPPSEVLGRPIGEVLSVGRAGTSRDVIWEQLRELGYWHGEIVHETATGHRLWAHWVTQELKLPGEPETVYIGVARDLSQFQEMVQRISAGETRYRALFDHSRLGIAVYRVIDDGQDFVFIDFNRAAEEIEGVKKEALLGRRVTEVFPGVRDMGLLDSFRRVWQTGVPELDPVAIYRSGQQTSWRENYLFRLPMGEVVAIYRDITAQKEAEQEIRHLATFPQLSPFPVLELNAAGEVVFVNEAVRRALREQGLPDDPQLFLPLDLPEILVNAAAGAGVEARREVEVGALVFDVTIFPVVESNTLRVYAADITERVRAEKALRESEEEWRSLVELASDGICVLQNDRTQYLNPQLARMLGYSLSELHRQPFEQHVHPNHRPLVRDLIRRYLSGERKLGMQAIQLVARDGQMVLAEINASRLQFRGQPAALVVLRDVTERHALTGQLESERALFTAFMNNIPDNIYFKDRDSRFIKANRSVANWLGLAHPDQIIGRTDADFFAPEIARQFRANELEVILTGQPIISAEEKEVHLDGREAWVLTTKFPLRDTNGEIIGTFGISRDITERKRVEEMLRESEERFRVAAQVSNDLIYERDCLTGEARFFGDIDGQQGYEPGGYPRTMEGVIEHVHPEDRLRLIHAVEQAAEKNRPFEVTYRLRTRYGTYNDWIDRGLLIRDREGRPQKWIGTATNITEQRRMETEQARLTEQLQQAMKMEAVGRLAGGVAHDFNNLLTGIIGYAEMITTTLAEGDPLREEVLEIKYAADRAAALTEQLLAFSRKQIIAPKLLDLNAILARGQKMVGRIIGEDVTLVFRPGEDVGLVRADPHQLDQILVNLAVNARDAMPDGGDLIVETQVAELDENYIGLHPGVAPGEYVVLAVSDTGVGMTDEVKRHLFEPFFTTKEQGKGTGLGLSTVYGIVKQNGGTISVYSEPGVGTTFKIYLPRVHGQAPAPVEVQRAVPCRGHETILLVEDEAMVRSLAKKVLTMYGFDVLEADDGGEAFLLCRQFAGEIHLLLTDVIMPVLNGRELYQQLVAMRPNLKVLYMSGYTEDVIAHQGLLDEAIQFIQKPFAIEDLVAKVRETLDLKD